MAKTKDAHCEVESEGRRRKSSGPTNRNLVRPQMRERLQRKLKPNSYTESSEVSIFSVAWGYSLQEKTPLLSTASYNFKHRFTTEKIDQVFNWLLDEIAESGYLSPKAVFIAGTHIKANANTKKQVKLLVEIKNPYIGEVVMREGLPMPGREGHGYGCRSIRAIAEKHHGLCSFAPERGLFTLRIILPISQAE